ncbi:MAG: HutP family protein [Oscillospiraceae bacterium]|jgi:hutP family protein|nr:MAG: HutP family protein [Oscillospiraceae bacterium]
MTNTGSKEIAKAAVLMSMTNDREDEKELKQRLVQQEIMSAAVDCGGEFIPSMSKFVERAVVAAKREGIINDSHLQEGAVAGAAHEALTQISSKALGLSVGGKIGIARKGDHVAVAVYFAIGLLHLNDIAVGLGHRAI